MSALFYRLRALNYLYGLGMFGVMCLFGAPFALPLAVAPLAWRARYALLIRLVAYHSFRFVRWHCRVTGFAQMRLIDHRPNAGTSQVLIANHLTMFDVVLLFGFIPRIQTLVNAKFLANPLLWPIIRACGYIPLRVGDAASGVEAFSEVEAAIKRGETVVLFPEGTRSESGDLGPLSRGAFRLAANGATPPSFVFFTCNQAFLNRAAFFPLHAGPVILEAHVMPPVDRDPSGAIPDAEALRAMFIEQYRDFTKSQLALHWNSRRRLDQPQRPKS